MNKTEMEKDWLFGNSVVAIAGAFILGMAWRPTGGEYTYPIINVTVSRNSDWFFIAIGAFLLFAAFFFGLTSIVPFLRNHASGLAAACSPILKIFVFAGFILSLSDAIARWPEDQWWTGYLFLFGVLFLPIIFLKMFQDLYRRPSRDSSRSTDSGSSGESQRSGGLLLGSAVIFMFVLISMLWPARRQLRRTSD